MNITGRVIRHRNEQAVRFHVRHYNQSTGTWTLETLDGDRKGEARPVNLNPTEFEISAEDGWIPLSTLAAR